MTATLRNAWKVPNLKKRMIYTFFMVVIFRLGNFIPVPGVDTSQLSNLVNNRSLFSFYDLLSGGAFTRFSIFAMGVTPYINASIIMQLLTVAIPSLEALSKEGEEGRKKIQNYTRYMSVPLGALQAFSTYAIITRYGALRETTAFNVFLIILTLTTASVFLMWLGEQITVKGIGNGVSLIIFVNIISRLPQTVLQIAGLQSTGQVNPIEVAMFIIVAFAMLVFVVISSLSERRIPIHYAGKTIGRRSIKGQSTYMPINMNASGIIAIIFAISVMQFPTTIGSFWPNSKISIAIMNGKFSPFNSKSWLYAFMYFVLIVFFTWFYTEVTFKPDEMAENMHKSSGFIPGIRPGRPTAEYIEKVLFKVSMLGGIFAAIVAIVPILVDTYTQFKGISFGGTSLLIEVGVAIETVNVLESQLTMRHYRGFLS